MDISIDQLAKTTPLELRDRDRSATKGLHELLIKFTGRELPAIYPNHYQDTIRLLEAEKVFEETGFNKSADLLAPRQIQWQDEKQKAQFQEKVLGFYESLFDWVSSPIEKSGVQISQPETTPRQQLLAAKADVLNAVITDRDITIGKLPLSLKNIIDVKGKPIVGILPEEIDMAKQLLIVQFDPKDQHVFTLNKSDTDKLISEWKTKNVSPEKLKRVKEIVGAYQQAYNAKTAEYVRSDRMDQLAAAVNLELRYRPDKSPSSPDRQRRKAIEAIMGDVAAGKGTLTKNLGINEKEVVVSGTGGLSKNPIEAYLGWSLTTSGMEFAVDSSGFPKFMDVLLLPVLAATRRMLDKQKRYDEAILIDGFPRSPIQAKYLGLTSQTSYSLPGEMVLAYTLNINEVNFKRRTLSRLYTCIIQDRLEELRPDDISALKSNTTGANCTLAEIKDALNQKFETVAQGKVLREKMVGLKDSHPEFIAGLEQVLPVLAEVETSYGLGSGQRYDQYHKEVIPQIMKLMLGAKAKPYVFEIDNLTRDEVAMLVAVSIGKENIRKSDSDLIDRFNDLPHEDQDRILACRKDAAEVYAKVEP